MKNLMHSKKLGTDSQLFESLNSGNVAGFGPDEWFTTEEAAAFLKVSSFYLRNLASNGKVPYHKFQRRNRYRKSELISLLLDTRKGEKNGI